MFIFIENPHLCEQKCHEGPCVRCELKTKYVCKCGSRSKEIKCNSVTSELTCKKKCNKVKSFFMYNNPKDFFLTINIHHLFFFNNVFFYNLDKFFSFLIKKKKF